jgi:hypothetical protein
MGLQDPVAVYNATSNHEAQLVCIHLNEAGVEAYVTEDLSFVGVWALGFLPEINKPQVWVDRSAIEQTKPLLEEFENEIRKRLALEDNASQSDIAEVEAFCEECGQGSFFPATQLGSIQDCPQCGAYMDIGEASDHDEWREDGPEDQAGK